jgi:hypothetical protein
MPLTMAIARTITRPRWLIFAALAPRSRNEPEVCHGGEEYDA